MLQFIKQKEKWITALLVTIGLTLMFMSQRISPYISYSLPLPSPTVLVKAVAKVTIVPPTPTVQVFSPTALPEPTKQIEVPLVLRQAGEKALNKNFSLVIPKLDVVVPIIANVNGGDTNTYLKALENGVAHFDGTSLPDQIGRTFIFGHSSYWANKPGNYKHIFAGLDKLVNGDDVLLWYHNELLHYKVVEKKFILPTDLSVLLPTAKKTLTLQACWPIGSTKERIIINAELIT
jgi:LPXTG-site transpeptidase (sortase) family protein